MHFNPQWVKTEYYLATFSSIQSRPSYTCGQLTETIGTREFLTYHYHLCKCTVRSAEAAFQFESRYINLSANRDLGEVQRLVSCYRKIPICCPYLCRKDGGWMGKRQFCKWMRISTQVKYDTNNMRSFTSDSTGRVNLLAKHSTKRETMHVQCCRNLPVPKIVVNFTTEVRK